MFSFTLTCREALWIFRPIPLSSRVAPINPTYYTQNLLQIPNKNGRKSLLATNNTAYEQSKTAKDSRCSGSSMMLQRSHRVRITDNQFMMHDLSQDHPLPDEPDHVTRRDIQPHSS